VVKYYSAIVQYEFTGKGILYIMIHSNVSRISGLLRY